MQSLTSSIGFAHLLLGWLALVADSGTLVRAQTPTSSPSSPPCEICGEGRSVGFPNAISSDAEGDSTCGELEMLGLAGSIPAAACTALSQDAVLQSNCGCFDSTPGPTSMPTLSPTLMPTSAPTTVTPVEGTLVIVLRNVFDQMSPGNLREYRSDLVTFLDESLAFYSNWIVTLQVQRTIADTRRLRGRFLQLGVPGSQPISLVPLETRLRVTANRGVFAGEAANRASFEQEMMMAVNDGVDRLAQLLSQSDSLVNEIYFESVQQIEAFRPNQPIVLGPFEPGDDGRVPNDPDPSDDDTEEGGLSARAIAGISAAGGFLAVLLVGIVCVVIHGNPDANREVREAVPSSGKQKSRDGPMGDEDDEEPMSEQQDEAPQPAPASPQGDYDQEEYQDEHEYENSPPPADREISIEPYTEPEPEPEPYTEPEPEPEYMEDEEDKQPSNGYDDPVETQDNGGYNYNQDAGQVDNSTLGNDTFEPSLASGDYDQSVPPEEEEEEEEPAAPVAEQKSLVTREVMAPPGKLGIVIETTLEGPIVHEINRNSPLEGQLFKGDLIAAIDDIDTRAMSASAITSLMVRTANQQRRLTIKSEDKS